MDELEAKVRCLEIAARIATGGDNPLETVALAGRKLYDSLHQDHAAPKPGTLHVSKKDK